MGYTIGLFAGRANLAAHPIASEIDHNLAPRLGTTNQHAAGSRWIDWVGPVGDRAGHKPGFTSVTDSRAARPSRRDVARCGKLKEALKGRAPTDIQAASGEGNQRSLTGRPGRQVRRPVRRSGNARGIGWAWAEKLGMDMTCSNAPGCKARGQITHERRWPADEEVRVSRHSQFPQHPDVQTSMSIEIYT